MSSFDLVSYYRIMQVLALLAIVSVSFASRSFVKISAGTRSSGEAVGKWPGDVITIKVCDHPWGIDAFTWNMAHQAAINQYANVIPVHLKRVSKGHADIEVTMIRIDGPNKKVAITFPPKDNNDNINGDIHLDNSEYWYSSYRPKSFGHKMAASTLVGPDSFIDIYQVMLHNLGLALGMLENKDKTSVMYFDYLYQDLSVLSKDDVREIQHLYGVRVGPDFTVATTTTTTTTTTLRPPQTTTVEPEGGYDKCTDGKLDAITMGTDGQAYAFRGKYFFKLRHRAHLFVKKEIISEGWPGLPDYLDAAVHLDSRRDFQNAPEGTYFFKGFNVYRYMGRVIQPGYPKPIDSLFPGIPHDLDSIFQVTNRLIARKGIKCYEVETPFKSRGFPCNSEGTMLAELKAPGIDAAFYWPRYKHTYYFSGAQYWRLGDVYKALPQYPKSTKKYFLGCR